MGTTTAPFADVFKARRSTRKFLPTPMPAADLRGVLEDARTAPSNSNTQPWTVHVVSGTKRDALSGALLQAFAEDRNSLDFTLDYGDGVYAERARTMGEALYGAQRIRRSDVEGRRQAIRNNLAFFGAPHAAFLFMPLFGDGVRTAADMGIYAQTFLLSLKARGFDGIAQTVLGMYADVVREVLGVSPDFKLLFGISFGTADPNSIVNHFQTTRVPLQHSVVLHDTAI